MAKKKPSREKRRLRYPDGLFSPKDWLRFVQLTPFERAWKELKLDDTALRALEISIMADPTAPPVEPDTGGLRKLRFAPAKWGTGKSGAARIYYVYFADKGLILLVHAYRKTRAESLSKQERNAIRKLIDETQRLFDNGPSAKP
jgi:hypothetical protein